MSMGVLPMSTGVVPKSGVPISPRSIAIHGITDDMVQGALPFVKVWPDLQGPFAERVVIGHNIGFDLAVLKRESERLATIGPELAELEAFLSAR